MSDNTRTGIQQVNSDVLANQQSGPLTIGQLEQALLAVFPAEDAESWDRTGLLAGDRSALVSGVAVALDVTTASIALAESIGANVLLTHHPAYLDAPDSFHPFEQGRIGSGAVVWEAVSRGVALMNFHTALDVSPQAARVLPSMLGLNFEHVLEPIEAGGEKGYGQVCRFPDHDTPLTLSQLAARCVSVFGRIPRVYGDAASKITSLATCTGSASNLVTRCLEAKIDCLICGEARYHTALDAVQTGLCIIELGHDVSELPLCAVLAQAAGAAGVDEDKISILDQGQVWWTPEATRR